MYIETPGQNVLETSVLEATVKIFDLINPLRLYTL